MAIFFRAIITAICFAAFARGAETHFVPFALEGQTFIHDPSTIVKEKGNYYIFATGPGIRAKTSPDLIHWTNCSPIFIAPPAWTEKAVPNFGGYFWAPDVIRVNGKYFLFYSVSTFGKKTSAIGVATCPKLNPSAANHLWADLGPVIESNTNTPFNAIDPSAFLDEDGKLWLTFGSYWRGIYLTELNPQTGKRIATNSPLYKLAWNDSIEASCLTKHGKFYYLFVNWGECCKGTNSTYQVRVGRSEKITGPYLDRDGYDLAGGAGTQFLQSSGRFIGPGHIGILTESNMTYFSYHYYDADTHGRSRLAIGKIDWSSGWPEAMK
ncbi:MAG TPA: arabinan endo-1,5-alpha-L-arabinosidase [Verrucomicrobiae bacterium]|nr:arabinan endo-1,5-alpha-L-arabinosidase [Verrucomicrobiae bacterium]